MNVRLTIAILALTVSGCVGPFKKSVWSPAEVAEWYERWSHPSTVHRGIGYQGSDEAFHYFIARPIDYFVFIRIPRHQLKLEDARPRQQVSSGSLGVHYWVDPLDGFRKKEPNKAPEPTPTLAEQIRAEVAKRIKNAEIPTDQMFQKQIEHVETFIGETG